MNSTKLNALVATGLLIFIFTELISAIILMLGIWAIKNIDGIPLNRHDLVLYKHDLPYVGSLLFDRPSTYQVVADPHLSFYNPHLRFGAKKSWLDGGSELEHSQNILVLGGSTVEGDGASDQSKTIVAQIEKALNTTAKPTNCEKPIKVLNEGSSGYTAKQQYLLLVYGLHPLLTYVDLVITLDGVNEYLAYSSNRRLSSHPFRNRISTREHEMIKITDEYLSNYKVERKNTIQYLYKLTFTGRLALSIFNLVIDTAPIDAFGHVATLDHFDIPVDERLKDYAWYRKATRVILESLEIDLIQALQPTLPTKLNLDPVEQGIRFNNKHYTERFWQNFSLFYRAVVKDFDGYDLSHLLDNETEQMYTDHVHYTDKAQKIIGLQLAHIAKIHLSSICASAN